MKKRKKSIFITALCLTLASIIGAIFQSMKITDTNIILIYMLAVVITARYSEGYRYGIISSVASTFMFNYFFTQPYYTLSVYDARYWMTFLVMMVTAIIMSASTTRIKQATEEAKQNARHAQALYTLTNHISDSIDARSLLEEIVKIVSTYFNFNVSCIYLENDPFVVYKEDDIIHAKALSDKQIASKLTNLQTPYYQEGEYCYYPLYGIQKLLGVLVIEKESVETIDEEKRKLLVSFIENISLALDHIYSIEEQLRLKEATVKERFRGNLLRAISHDLRTPLSGIMGTSEMIMDMNEPRSINYSLAQDIYDESNWLYLMVENILSLTKVQEGKLQIHKQYEVLEEVIGSAIHHVSKNRKDYQIDVTLPDEILMIPMDAKLIQQVFINVLDNAMKHCQENKKIEITCSRNQDKAYIIVEDYGSGLKKQDFDMMFEMFYTKSGHLASDQAKGVGLGLTICKAIVEAHDGTIVAQNCLSHQGAKFIISLPMEETK